MNVFLFDGNCPFCLKTAKLLEAKCLSPQVKFLSFRSLSEKQLKELHPNLTKDVLTANVQYICKGVRYPGFFAIRKLAIHLKFFRYFFWILYLPLIPIIGILVMNYLKEKRNHVP